MKLFLTSLALGLTLSVNLAHAADPAPAKTPQQNKMVTCNKEAGEKGLEKDARKAFMKDCLSAKPAGAPASDKKTAQQEKMKACNKDAGEKALKGKDRKDFMSICLKG